MELTFKGEELELVIEALRAAVPTGDPVGEGIMLRYLSKKLEDKDVAVEEQGRVSGQRRIGFV